MKKTNQDSVTSRDIYALAFFLTKTACKIESIEATEELGKPACVVTVSGENLKKLQLDYLNNHAPVDAVSYRKSLSYIRSLVYGEMSKAKRQSHRLISKSDKATAPYDENRSAKQGGKL